MAISFVASAATTSNNTATVPTGTQDGDVCLIFCYRQATGGSTATGFSQIFTRDLSSSSITVLVKQASGEGSSWTLSNTNAAVAFTFRGAGIPASWNQVNAASGSTGTLSGVASTSALMDVFYTWNTTGAVPAHSTPTNYTAPTGNTTTESFGAGNMRASAWYRLSPPAGNNSVTNSTTSTVNGCGLIEIPLAAVDLLQASETDTAFALTRTKSSVLGTAQETDTAAALDRSKSSTLGRATETDTVPAVLVRTKSRVLGIAADTETVQALGRTKVTALGRADETDLGVHIPRAGFVRPIGTASDTSTVPTALGRAKSSDVGTALDAETAFSIVSTKSAPLGRADDTETAPALERVKSVELGLATESDSAPFVRSQNIVSVHAVAPVAVAHFGSETKLRGPRVYEVPDEVPLADDRTLFIDPEPRRFVVQLEDRTYYVFKERAR